MTVVLASGRPTGSILPYAEQLGLAEFGGFIVGFNGAEVTDCRTGELLFQKSLSRQDLHHLYDLSRVHRLFIQSYRGQEILTPQNNPYTEVERRLTGLPIREVADFKAAFDGPAAKVILLEDPARLKAAAPIFQELLKGRMNVCISKPFFLEVMAEGVDKRHSLDRLVRDLGYGPEHVMAVGDSYNDVGMLEYAGLGVCMANGPAEVRDRADHVTGHHNEDGVAEAVERFLGIEV